MQTFTGVANASCQGGFNIHVHIFERDRPVKIASLNAGLDRIKPIDNGRTIVIRDDPGFCQHGRMGPRTGDVLPVHALIEANRTSKFLHEGIG